MKNPVDRARRALLLLAPLGYSLPAQRRRASRGVRGVVNDPRGKPIQGASVRLKNLQTLRIRSYLSGKDGAYRFTNVSLGGEYEITAFFGGRRSDAKSIRWYDEGTDIEVNLVIDPSGPAEK